MPIIGWDCPICKHQVPLDHYDTTGCGLAIHPDYAMAVLHSNDDYYGKDLLTVTAGLGCPRSRAIEYDTPVYVNPTDYNALLIGKAWDNHLEKYAPPLQTKIRLDGTIEGLSISGEIDRVRKVGEFLTIEDHKHSGNFQQKWVKKERDEAAKEGKSPVKMEYRIQTAIYAELFAQQFGERPTRGIIWNHYSGAAQYGPEGVLLPIAYDLPDLATCLAHKPYGGEFTVLELYRQAAGYHAAPAKVSINGGVDVAAAFALPLAGASMSFGAKTMCDYCQVQKACMAAATGAPF
jgi:hypothetical protein